MKLILATLLALACSVAHARTVTLTVPDTGCITVRHLSVPGGNAVLDTFDAASFDSVIGPVWNFSGTCGVTPPPVDPGAYTTAAVKWLTFPVTPTRTIDVTQFANVFGRINSLVVTPLPWTYANGASVQLVDTGPKYFRLHGSIAPGTPPSQVILTAIGSYGSSPAGLRARFAIVATGAPWPTGTANGCWVPDTQFRDNRIMSLKYRQGSTTNFQCSVPNEFDVLIDALGAGGTMAISSTGG